MYIHDTYAFQSSYVIIHIVYRLEWCDGCGVGRAGGSDGEASQPPTNNTTTTTIIVLFQCETYVQSNIYS